MNKTKNINKSFGERYLNKFSVGDLVKWKTWELTPKSPDMFKQQHIGVILDLFVENRGDRDVAMVRVLNIDSQMTSDVMAMCLNVVSKAISNEHTV
tara:strand:+ start:103 stop:390 length:288 start_codon:yes stop_codon:yes gene_type:complete